MAHNPISTEKLSCLEPLEWGLLTLHLTDWTPTEIDASTKTGSKTGLFHFMTHI